jgi:hypothetical protein
MKQKHFLLCIPGRGQFYKSPNSWVYDPLKATAFPDKQRLLEECKQLSSVGLAMFTFDEHDRLQSVVRLSRDDKPKT